MVFNGRWTLCPAAALKFKGSTNSYLFSFDRGFPAMSENIPADDVAAVQRCEQAYNRVRDELSKVVVGQNEVIEQVLVAVFARGHALLEGVPGLAKTLLISSVAESLHLSFKRIQFT